MSDVLLSSDRVSAATLTIPPGEAASETDGFFYALEGELTFDAQRAGPNTAVFAPAAVANEGDAPARCLQVTAPGAEPAVPVFAEVPRGINVVVRGAHSNGRLAVMDNSVGPRVGGPPLHHHEFDELFYVVEGELTFQLGEEIVTRGAGEVAFARGGDHHTWANHSGAPARMLIVCTPAGFEPYFGRMAAERAGVEPPAWALEPVPPTTVVGPQIPG
jgi:mannose-6-phosphate isomerase-like protein (cupin superfamily)